MHILGIGGATTDERHRRLNEHAVELSGAERPRICFLPTAVGDQPEAIVRFYARCEGLGELSHATFHPWPRPDLSEHLLGCDVVVVSGGNTANMLAIWRVHAVDELLREAWRRGVVLTGGSAGMICWFEACVTDSFGPQLEGLRDGLGLLAGSACPHYDGEERRRPVYRKLVDGGFPPGVAADDDVGVHYEGTELAEVVACRAGARAYRVEPGAETPLDARVL